VPLPVRGDGAHRKGTAHEFSPEKARKARYLGGKSVSVNREHMVTIGRKGGQRGGRAVNEQKKAEMPDQYDTNVNSPGTSHSREHPQQVGDSSSVILPHWRETPVDPSQQSEEEQEKQDNKEQTHRV